MRRGWWLLFALATLWALVQLEITPDRVSKGLGRLGAISAQMIPPEAEGHFVEFALGLLETMAMAMAATVLAGILAFPLGLLGAGHVVPATWLRWPLRRGMDVARSIDALLWSLLFVSAVGLGPMAGVLALVMISLGSLAKLLSETVDRAPLGAMEGMRAVGANRWETVRYGILPQVWPVYLGQVLYYFESNIRHATILGIVGAGGIGMHLADRLRVNEWRQVSLIVLLILVAVTATDRVSRWLRGQIEKGTL